jgi:hypothetical protein
MDQDGEEIVEEIIEEVTLEKQEQSTITSSLIKSEDIFNSDSK